MTSKLTGEGVAVKKKHCNSIQFKITLPLQPSLLGISTSTMHQADTHIASVKGGPDQSPDHGNPLVTKVTMDCCATPTYIYCGGGIYR